MLTFEESDEAIAQMVEELPPEILHGLNCGISLRHDTLYDENGLIILGQYHNEPMGLGRYVTIHYGSMVRVYGHLSKNAFRKELRHVLHHELTHHIESLAGDRSLEKQDAIDKRKFLGKRR